MSRSTLTQDVRHAARALIKHHLRHRFAHAKLPVLAVSGDARLADIPDVRVVPEASCAEDLLAAVAAMGKSAPTRQA